jgi:hypothetical protein
MRLQQTGLTLLTPAWSNGRTPDMTRALRSWHRCAVDQHSNFRSGMRVALLYRQPWRKRISATVVVRVKAKTAVHTIAHDFGLPGSQNYQIPSLTP